MTYAGKVPAHPNEQLDEPVKIPLEPEEALRALMQVKPEEDEKESRTREN